MLDRSWLTLWNATNPFELTCTKEFVIRNAAVIVFTGGVDAVAPELGAGVCEMVIVPVQSELTVYVPTYWSSARLAVDVVSGMILPAPSNRTRAKNGKYWAVAGDVASVPAAWNPFPRSRYGPVRVDAVQFVGVGIFTRRRKDAGGTIGDVVEPPFVGICAVGTRSISLAFPT